MTNENDSVVSKHLISFCDHCWCTAKTETLFWAGKYREQWFLVLRTSFLFKVTNSLNNNRPWCSLCIKRVNWMNLQCGESLSSVLIYILLLCQAWGEHFSISFCVFSDSKHKGIFFLNVSKMHILDLKRWPIFNNWIVFNIVTIYQESSTFQHKHV